MIEVRELGHQVISDDQSKLAEYFDPVYDISHLRGMILGDIDDNTSGESE